MHRCQSRTGLWRNSSEPTGTSVNPARSTGPALVVGGWAIAQLWLFWVAPLIAAALAGLAYRGLSAEGALSNTGPDLRAPRRW
jgi:glycerol uptake facilitator-like aquaporin